MSKAATRPLLLSNARLSDVAAEIGRRFEGWLASLPDGTRWTRTDYVFAGVVATMALTSTGFFTAAYKIWSDDPTYFSRRLIASMEDGSLDTINTGSVEAGEGGAASGDALPVLGVVRETPLKPADYEIVMIFGGEAWLATARELFRAKVGSVLPGLGRVLSIDAVAGSLEAEEATLRSVTR